MPGPAYTFVQQTQAAITSNPGNVPTPSINTTAGNLLLVTTMVDNASPAQTLTSTQGDVFTLITTALDVGTRNLLSLYKAIAKGGATIFNVASGGFFPMIAVFEYSSPGAAFTLMGQATFTVNQFNLGANSVALPALGSSGPALAFAFGVDAQGHGGPTAGTLPVAFTGRTPVWTAWWAAAGPGVAEDVSVASGDVAPTFGGVSGQNQYDRGIFVAASFSLAPPFSPQQIKLDDPARVGGSSQLFLGTVTGDGTGDGLKSGGADLKLWAADINAMFAKLFPMTQTVSDAALVLVLPTIARVVYYNTTLTANRAVTLPASGMVDGDEFHIVRRAAVPGAFTLTVTDPVSGKSEVIGSGLNGFSRWRAVSPTEWICMAHGTYT